MGSCASCHCWCGHAEACACPEICRDCEREEDARRCYAPGCRQQGEFECDRGGCRRLVCFDHGIECQACGRGFCREHAEHAHRDDVGMVA